MIARDGGEAINLEGTTLDTSILYPEDGVLVHTNNFIGHRSLTVKDEYIRDDASSLYRYTVAKEILRRKKGYHSVKTLKELFRNHFDFPSSICLHVDPSIRPDLQEETLTSIIFNLSSRQIYATKGPPCVSNYQEYRFPNLSNS
jgi:isopenicillin-N N-acyltransferase-like protein